MVISEVQRAGFRITGSRTRHLSVQRACRCFDLPAAGCVPGFPLKDLAQSLPQPAFRSETDVVPERAPLGSLASA